MYGDGGGPRWRDIADLNPALDAHADLPVGAAVVLPDDAPASPSSPHQAVPAADDSSPTATNSGSGAASVSGPRSVTVQPGDTLYGIAQTHLGDGDRYRQIFDANRGERQPGGGRFENPALIYPGQKLNLPDTHASEHPTTHASHPAHHDHTPTADSPPPVHHHSTADTPAPATSAPQAHRTPTPRREPAAHGASDSHASGISTRTVAGIGLLLAALIVTSLGTLRVIQQRRRRPGETIAMPDEASQLEQALTAASSPASAELLDTALRTLAHHAAATGTPPPALRGARITQNGVALLPDTPSDPPPPFTAAGRWWTLPADADLLDQDTARQTPAPYPGLATLGTGEDGALYLINLPHIRAVLLDGDETHVHAVCASLALEASMSPWADQSEILLAGFGAELPPLLPTSRMRHVPTVSAAVRDLGERLLEDHQDPDHASLPWMLICATHLTPDEAWQLADALGKAPSRVNVAVVLPSAGVGDLLPEATRLRADEEPQQVDTLDALLRVQSVPADAYQQLLATLAVAEEPATPSAGPWEHVPGEPATPAEPLPDHGPTAAGQHDDAEPVDTGEAGTASEAGPGVFPALLAAAGSTDLRLLPPPADEPTPDRPSPRTPAPDDSPAGGTTPPSGEQPGPADDAPLPSGETLEPEMPAGPGSEPVRDLHGPELRVLGPLDLTGIGTSGHGPKLAALAALLYFRPNRDASAICEAMDPASPWSSSTLNSRLHGLRSRLGTDADGNLYVPRRTSSSSPYRLSPAVRCDWTRFQQLAERGLAGGPAGVRLLEDALALVRGRPMGGRDLPWAAPLQQEMISRIVDVAHTVAVHRSTAGPHRDLDAARHAIAVGLEVEPTTEMLYRDWMRVEHAAGNRGGLHSAITNLQQANRAYDLDCEPETEQLIAELLSDPTPGRSAS